MSLEPGIAIGPYQVTARIGEGGMGEVYRARDTKLDRDVALKVLPEAFTADADRLGRFEREAKVLASLNHPNIGGIHGLEESDGVRALVLELIEGPTLADRIAQGPIPIDLALPITRQIAEALEAAHEQGVIHRDLKPANIKVRDDGTVKVLDFGLAKAFQPEASDPNMSLSPTVSLTAAATQMGMIVGTAAYMAPEQAAGKAVDKRADVWAFGVVLFEMLTGQRLFSGEDVSHTLAYVLTKEIDWSPLAADTPDSLRRLLRRCLERDPRKRMRDIGEARIELDDPKATESTPRTDPVAARPLRLWQRPVPLGLAALALLALGGLAVSTFTGPDPNRVTRFAIPLADDMSFSSVGRPLVAISPAGDRVAFVADNDLWLRPLDQMEATLVAGSDGARHPFFSADGQWLGFQADGQLKRVSVNGGVPVALGAANNPFGISWGTDDRILFSQADGIWRVPGTGGTPERVISVDEGELVHGPQLLPGGDLVLFTLRPAGVTSWDAAQIVVQSLASGDRTVLIEGGRSARYVPTGHLVYALNGTLLAQGFDLDQRTVQGGAVALVDGVRSTASSGVVMFSVSSDGTLVFVPGTSGSDGDLQLVWVDRQGNEEFLDVEAAPYERPRLSADGTRVAVEIQGDDGTSAVWVADAARGTLLRVTDAPASAPIWTPDGQHLVFASQRDGESGLFRQSADGTGEVEHLATLENSGRIRAGNWSPDGSRLVVSTRGNGNIGVLTMEGEPSWSPLLDSTTTEDNPAISPDGQWIAYESDDTGRTEIYVERFPELGLRQPISTDGGYDPIWSPDGRELFYLGTRGGGAPDDVVVVTFDPGPPASVGTPEVLFDYRLYRSFRTGGRPYDLHPDGQRFLMMTDGASRVDGATGLQPQINVVLNWFEELEARVPVN